MTRKRGVMIRQYVDYIGQVEPGERWTTSFATVSLAHPSPSADVVGIEARDTEGDGRVMSDEQCDSMGQRLDETRKTIERLKGDLNERRNYFELNPHTVFSQVLPSVYGVLTKLHETTVMLDHRLNQLEKRD